MIELMQNSHRIALIENPVWIYKLPNGDFGLTDREHAQGLTYNGTVYNIGGLGDEYEYASANEINSGDITNTLESAVGINNSQTVHNPGDYVTANNKLYRVTVQIPVGGRIAPGTNCVETNISEELAKLM